MSANCCVWDFTLRFDKDQYSPGDEKSLKDLLICNTKKFAFQLECGEKSEYLHWQGRISLKIKKRLTGLKTLFNDTILDKCHWSPTSAPNMGNVFYTTKEDTRIAGPWQDTDEIIYIPRQIRDMGELRPFQQHIVDSANTWDTRTINVLYCPNGNIGKSLLVGYCRAHKVGRALPPVNDHKDLLRMVCDLPTSNMYLFDMPRCMNKDRLYGFYSAVETIKDGYAYDDRYSFREKVFDCPIIWIFTNTMPNTSLLSKDRWKIWGVTQNYELFNYEEETYDPR